MRLFTDDNIAVACIWAEARGESQDGKTAVAEVIRNRMRRKYFSHGDVVSTVFWPYQFSWANTDNKWRADVFNLDNSDGLVRRCFDAWVAAEHTDLTHGAVLYANVDLIVKLGWQMPSWAHDDKRTATVGNHSFFRD